MLEAGEAPCPGFSTEKISFEMVISAVGHPLYLNDLRSHAGKRPAPVQMEVPQTVKRSSGIKPNLFWDKTAYVLGVTAVEDSDGQLTPGQGKRTADEHAAFAAMHCELLEGIDDDGLRALLAFLDKWKPEFFAARGFPVEALDQNIVFRLDGDTGPNGAPRFLHQRSSVLPLLVISDQRDSALCLVTGKEAPLARLHPSIKGVMGAQSSGASLVSFNDQAYESFGKSQGENAPVSEQAAFAYGTALNRLLAKDSTRNLRVGDTTIAFWAEAETPEAAGFSEMLMSNAFSPPDEAAEANMLRAHVRKIAEGRAGGDPKFDPSTRVYLLGLAPNAARLSVRFWHPGSFGDFARNVARFWDDLTIEPAGWKGPPAAWSLLYETAIHVGGKARADTIPPLLGGNVMRSVLTGQPLPRTLLSAVVGRIRADGHVNGRRAAVCKAVVNRISTKEEIPVSLDPDNTNPAYRLGRLFAVLERAQEAALPSLNATIKDRYFAAASATPARVFPLLVKNANHHLSLVKKGESGGLGRWLEKQLGLIWLGLEADLPRALALEDQGRFIAGYYHQRWTKSEKNGEDQ
ncbi:type I-C CRISPR-associated protein Cas8c/Csd1 [Ruegeria sediminis]|uniref:Type I-C CRISPR-associated protein Cas8c/Csd1 n=2 Tax=Ruegeria sediminis TaxID=2583820 RepID=A0ABY2WYZ4_9RHOB|nr:type I-C CRISPR-associated protein Cas8c/Csd1 [Ruegeria sediminis]